MRFPEKSIALFCFLTLLLNGCYLHAANEPGTMTGLDPGVLEVQLLPESPLSSLLSDTQALKSCKCNYEKRLSVLVEDRTVLDTISMEVYPYAIMSSNAYDRELQITLPGWARVKRVVSPHGFSADIYTSDDGKEVVIAFRGTDDPKDWRYGNLDTEARGQYADADEVFKMVKNQYGNRRIITVGHSLGGGLAIHVSLAQDGVDAFVFNPSPRLFSGENYGKYNNRVVVVYESGEILSLLRPLFTTLRKVRHERYRFNFIGGDTVKEHNIEKFARCMYASINVQDSHYSEVCKDNTLGFDSKD